MCERRGKSYLLRRRVKKDLALTVKKRGTKGKSELGQMVLALPADEVQGSAQMWAYTVRVSDVKYELAAIGQRYRDCCDCRACQVSGFDEPQRQWGWGGFTTQDMHRSQLTARAVALIYNGWSWTVRAVSHAGQTMLYLTPMHAEAGLIKSMIANVHAAISHARRAAEQLPGLDQRATLVDCICRKVVGQFALPTPPPDLTATG